MKNDWRSISQRLQSIAQAGLTFCENEYDRERYNELKNIAADIISTYTSEDFHKITEFLNSEKGYLTPKVDIRAALFKGDEILLVKEKADEKWSMPGGWADVNYTPFQIAEKEVFEEAGIQVKAKRLAAVLDKNLHNFPLDYHHIYKIFIYCEYVSGDCKPGMETLGAAYFPINNLPELSTPRITGNQIKMMLDFHHDQTKLALCD